MPLLFSIPGRQRLAEIVQPGMLCAFDYDGTLAPFVVQPERAQTPKSIIARLNDLANYANIAVITGRSVSDVNARLGFIPHFVIGNHGLEGVPGEEDQAVQYRTLCQSWTDLLHQRLSNYPQSDHNIWIENKGFSLSVHYRLARDRRAAEQFLPKLFAATIPAARIVAGKCVYNLLPQHAGNKGRALEKLITMIGAPSSLYVGDDVTDDDVFQLRRPDLLSIRVGHDSSSAADFSLPHRLSVLQLLDELLDQLRKIYPASFQVNK